MKKYFIAAMLACSLQLTFSASSEIQTLPPDILIKKVPDYAAWTAVYQYGGSVESKKPAAGTSNAKKPTIAIPRIQTQKVVKAKDILYVLSTDDQGGKEECWSIHGVQWVTPKGHIERQMAARHDSPFYKDDLPIRAFNGFRWISYSNYDGTVKFMNKDCCVYVKPGIPTKRCLAYVDATTNLPVCLIDGEVSCVYEFDPNPPKNIAMPDDIVRFMRDQAERTAKAMKPGSI